MPCFKIFVLHVLRLSRFAFLIKLINSIDCKYVISAISNISVKLKLSYQNVTIESFAQLVRHTQGRIWQEIKICVMFYLV